jgi:ribonucleoside-diphosphate reductase alpha chain
MKARISEIRKRDGRIVKFKREKITNAIYKAIVSVGMEEEGRELAEELTEKVVTEIEKSVAERAEIPSVEAVQDVVEHVLIKEGFSEIAKAYILYRQQRADIRGLKKFIGIKDDLKLSLNAAEVLKRRYLLKDEVGKVIESPSQMFERVATAIARAELKYGKSKEGVKEIEHRFYQLMRNLEFLPNSPTLMNAGTELGQLAACFVLPVDDSIEGIFGAVKNMALIHQCLVPETLVMTDKGLKRLEKVEEGDEIATHEGNFEVDEVHNNGHQKVFEVITKHGYSLVGTKEHKLRVVNKKGEHEWREIKDLEEGDWLILKPGGWSTDTDSDDLPSFEFKPQKGRNETSFKPVIHNLPDTVTPELAELIGLYIGDGSNHRDGIRFSVNKYESEILERIKWLSRKLFGKKVVVPEDKKRTWEVEILSKQIKEWFNFLQITKKSSKKAKIPSVILNGSREVAYSFLRGLFSADGCIRESGHIVFSTSSERLARELQIVMLYLGIPTRKTHYKRAYSKQYPELKDIYQIALCNKFGYSIFKENIGFLVHCKKKRLDNVNLSSIFTRGEHIPYQGFALKQWYSTLSREEKRRVRPLYSDIMYRRSKPRHLSYQKVERVVKEEELVPPFFHDLLRNNFFYSEVESIRPKAPRKVYDLTIPYKHAYIANGFVSHNSGGGTGFSFSRLRPKGDVVKSTGGVASGPVSFMRVFDVATDVIKQGGKRRGANMGILNAEHPDILEFIRAKERGEFANFNTSIAVTDEFMHVVERNEEYGLLNPRTKEEVKRIKAREVFNEIITYAWKTGDPGIIFLDEINRHNPISAIGKIEATNPCGEQPLLPYESCNLGSINVSKFVGSGKGEIDWERLREVVWICIRFLDDVIDVNRYPLPAIEKMTKANRKIGLGIMGFAELLIKLGIAYDSKDALLIGEKLMQFITNEARQCSTELGLEKGSFSNFGLSVWNSKYEAMRNATVTTIAPTGTISIIAGCSSGIEPLFAVAFVRNVMGGMLEINKLFEEIAKERGFYSKDLITEIAKCGSIQDIEGVPGEVKRVFVTALDISPEWHVRMQAAFQKYTDNSVSKTVNLPSDATWGDVKRAFLLAYKLKCKGITIYRYGSKEQVLSLSIPKLMLEEYVCADSEYTGECRICSV